MDLSSTVTLNNGVKMPQLAPGGETEQAVRWALEIGYRHVDTATIYRNEADVGKAIQGSGIPRESIFVTTKVWNTDQGYQAALKAFDASRRSLGLDVIDLYLVHWPVPGKFQDTWKALEKLYADGKVRAIGVSNFMVHHLEDLRAVSSVTPAANQVEFHPRLVQKDLLTYESAHGIQPEAWAPLSRGRELKDPLIVSLARTYGKTPAQIILRWEIQLGVVTIPKSAHRERILENSMIFDFELTPDDVDRITGLETAARIGMHPDDLT